jgi:hypothetical protein
MRVAPDGREAVLLHDGVLALDLERAAARADSGFWLATQGARVELTQGARVAVSAQPGGATRVVVVSGRLSLWSRREEVTSVQLAAGQTANVEASGAVRRATHRGGTLEQAAQELRAGRATEPRRTAEAGADGPALEAAVGRVLAHRERERELLARHRSARGGGAAGSADAGAMELQRALAEHAASSFRALRALRVQLALFEAAALGEGDGTALAAQIARARELSR